MEKIINFIGTFITNYINFFETISNMKFIVNGDVYVMNHDFIMAIAFIMLGAVVGIIVHAIINEIFDLIMHVNEKIRYKRNEKEMKKIATEMGLITTNN